MYIILYIMYNGGGGKKNSRTGEKYARGYSIIIIHYTCIYGLTASAENARINTSYYHMDNETQTRGR